MRQKRCNNGTLCQANCKLECAIEYAQGESGFNCTPWYFPTQDKPVKMCTPWESVQFEKIMFKDIPGDHCDYCLPDCSETQYTTSTTVVPFRRCDYKNLGVSYLCNLNDLDLPEPRIWGKQVIEEYENRGNGQLPWFIAQQVNRFTRGKSLLESWGTTFLPD